MHTNLPRWFALALVPTVLALAVPDARAQDAAATGAARQLVVQGMEDFKAGRFAQAMNQLERAFGVVKVPSVALWSARALAMNGKLVEASERYLEATQLSPEQGERELQLEAQELARQERDVLLPLVPQLTIAIEGVPAHEVNVRVGERTVASSLVGIPVPTNPGELEIIAHWGGNEERATVSLAEGGAERVTLTFDPAARREPEQSPDGPEPGESTPDSLPADDDETLRTLGWLSVGVGGAGLIFGGVTYMLTAAAKSDA